MTIKTNLADQLGMRLAQKANLGDEIDAVKAELVQISADQNERAFEGELFRATVTFGNKTVVDYKTILQLVVAAGFDEQTLERMVRENTKTAEGVPTVRCAARKS